jgi:carbamoylphosphate synthase large subunit
MILDLGAAFLPFSPYHVDFADSVQVRKLSSRANRNDQIPRSLLKYVRVLIRHIGVQEGGNNAQWVSEPAKTRG